MHFHLITNYQLGTKRYQINITRLFPHYFCENPPFSLLLNELNLISIEIRVLSLISSHLWLPCLVSSIRFLHFIMQPKRKNNYMERSEDFLQEPIIIRNCFRSSLLVLYYLVIITFPLIKFKATLHGLDNSYWFVSVVIFSEKNWNFVLQKLNFTFFLSRLCWINCAEFEGPLNVKQ